MYKMGDIVLDLDSKDIMKITNGVEQLDGVFTPTEAATLRVLCWRETKEGLYPKVGFTYRKFPTGANLSILQDCKLFDSYAKAQRKYVAGRF